MTMEEGETYSLSHGDDLSSRELSDDRLEDLVDDGRKDSLVVIRSELTVAVGSRKRKRRGSA